MADLYSCTAELQSFALKASLPAAFSRSASLPGLALTCRQSMPMSIQCRGLRHKHRCVMAMQPAMSLPSLHVTTAVQPTSAAALPHVQLRYSCQMYYPVGTAVMSWCIFKATCCNSSVCRPTSKSLLAVLPPGCCSPTSCRPQLAALARLHSPPAQMLHQCSALRNRVQVRGC